MRWPLANVYPTQEFGANAVDYSQFGLSGHHGRDLNAGVGTPVYAVEAGTVTTSSNGATDKYTGRFAAGEVIVINGTYETWYMHLSQRLVGAGAKVSEGQLIAKSGNTGFTTGPHLHFGTRPLSPNLNNGYRGFVDPRNVINQVTPAPSGGGNNMFNTDAEVQEAYLLLRGNAGSAAERAAWIGQTKQRFFQVARPEADSTRQQLADVKTALANLQAKPPTTVIKEVIKIVDRPVEKIVIKEVPAPTDPNDVTINKDSFWDWFKNLTSIFKKKG